jgi:sugar/nucleoside kinase (ribokinase family)
MITAVGNPVYDEIETPFIKTDGRVLSGCSTNFCLALAKLGLKTSLVGNVGDDKRGDLSSDLSSFGIDHCLFSSHETAGFSIRYYGDKGERELKLLGDAGSIAGFPKERAQSDWIVFAPILAEIDHGYVEMVKAISDSKTALDPQGILRRQTEGRVYHEKGPDAERIIGLCDIVKPNELECKVLTGLDPRADSRTPAEMIKSWGPQLVIITLAELGSVIYDGERFVSVPPYETLAKDSTGAGDTYLGGFIYGQLRGWDLYESGCMGSAVASVMIEQTGPGFPLTVEEAERRCEKLLKMKSETELLDKEGRADGQSQSCCNRDR